MNEATKAEIQKLLAQLQPKPKSRFSSLFLKIGAGYAAMAVFTTAAMFYSFMSLYTINKTARQIANTDLPAITTLIKLRSSLLAQEGFAGKYAIFKEATFIDLFRQRREDSIADLEALERTNSVGDIASLKRLYLDYLMRSDRLFAGKSHNREELHASALRLITALDSLYLERQDGLQTLLKRADERQKLTTRWAIGISGAGFVLSILIVPFAVYRVIRALGKLQEQTHKIASGHFNYDPQVPVLEEISELTCDFNQMTARIKEMELRNEDTLPLTRLPGNLAIERVLNERLKSGVPFSFCHVEVDNSEPFLAQYGFAKMAELLYSTGGLIHAAVTGYGTAKDFAGHAGGHNYVMVVSTDRVAAVCDAVVKGFDAEVIEHLSPEDRAAGGFQRCDCSGAQRVFPITTVFISVLDCSIQSHASAVDIARAAVDAKDSLKKGFGSRWERAT
jgi:HAMP domain-containing protein